MSQSMNGNDNMKRLSSSGLTLNVRLSTTEYKCQYSHYKSVSEIVLRLMSDTEYVKEETGKGYIRMRRHSSNQQVCTHINTLFLTVLKTKLSWLSSPNTWLAFFISFTHTSKISSSHFTSCNLQNNSSERQQAYVTVWFFVQLRVCLYVCCLFMITCLSGRVYSFKCG